jgi:hypothetical protein
MERHPFDGLLMALVAWARKMHLMPRTRPPYPPEFRREAVQLVLAGLSQGEQRDVVSELLLKDCGTGLFQEVAEHLVE